MGKAEENLQKLTEAASQSGLISDDTKKECQNDTVPTSGRAETLAVAILDKVGEEDSFFDVLVGVLRRIPALATLGNQLDDEFRQDIGGFRVPGRDEDSLKLLQNGASVEDSGIVTNSLTSQSATSVPPPALDDGTEREHRQNGHANIALSPDHGDLQDPRKAPATNEGVRNWENASLDLSTVDLETTNRHPVSIEEVGRAPSGDSIVTPSSGYVTQASIASSWSSVDEAFNNLRLEVSQQKEVVCELQVQVPDLTEQLETKEKEKRDIAAELECKEAELLRITEQKDREIRCLKVQVDKREREIGEFKQRIAKKEQDNEELRQRLDIVVKALCDKRDTMEMELLQIKVDYNSKLEEMEKNLKRENARKEQVAILLAQEREKLERKNAHYQQELRKREQEISELRLKLERKDTEMERMRANLADQRAKMAECNLEKEKLQHQNEKREAEERQREMEQKLQDEQQKRRESVKETERLRAQLAEMRNHISNQDTNTPT